MFNLFLTAVYCFCACHFDPRELICHLLLFGIRGLRKYRKQKGCTALMFAAVKGHAYFARLLVKAGADKDAMTYVRDLMRLLVLFLSFLLHFHLYFI